MGLVIDTTGFVRVCLFPRELTTYTFVFVLFGGVFLCGWCSFDMKFPSGYVLHSRQVADFYVRPDTYGHLVPSMTELVCMSGYTFFVASAL